MAITLFGTASQPADNGSYNTQPVSITPPSNMQVGDLVFVTICFGGSSGTISIPGTNGNTGGQSWTSLTTRNATRNRTRSFWCIFDGTWDANPSWDGTGTSNAIGRMLVFRPTGGTLSTWSVSVAESSGTYSAPSTPYTVTITGITTNYNNELVIAIWTSADDSTWDSLTSQTSGGYYWNAISPAQVRNTYGSYDESVSGAWVIVETAGATGNVSQNQATNGGVVGTRLIISFRETEQHSGAAAVSKGGALAALGMAAMMAISAVSGKGAITATGTASWSANPIVKVINETLQRPTYDLSGSAVVTGGGANVASGSKAGASASAISKSGAATATGSKGGQSAATESSAGNVVSSGQKGGQGAGSISGGGILSAAYSVGGQVASVVSSGGSVVVTGYKDGRLSPSVSAAGVISGTSSKGGAGGTSITAAGFVTATGEAAAFNAIVKVINEVLQRQGSILAEVSISSGGATATSGYKNGASAATVSGQGTIAASGTTFVSNPIVKVINETLQRSIPYSGSSAVTGAGSVAAAGVKGALAAPAISAGGTILAEGSAPRFLVQVINESSSESEGSFLMSQGIVQVVDESASLVEVILKNPAKASVVVSGSGSCATQGRKGGFGATQVTASGTIATEALTHSRPVDVSGNGTLSVTVSGCHYGVAGVTGVGRVTVVAGAPPHRHYQRSFTRMRTGDPKVDRAFQLIEEEFSRMLDYINRTTG